MEVPMSRTWFITGTSSGFGRLMTEKLLARGDRVAATARRIDALSDLKDRHCALLWAAELDVTNTAAIRDVVGHAFGDLGRIDVIVNNAGYGLFGAAEELSDQQILEQIETNLLGPIQVTRAALPHLREQGGGRIIQLSTYGGQAATAGASLYNASKFGVEGFMESLAEEVAPFGIGVTIVEPGGASTGFRGRTSQLAAPLAAYDDTPAAMVRGIRDYAHFVGDPAKIADAIIASADQEPAPRRLVLGSDAYTFIHAALTARLEEIEAQEATAGATDMAMAA
jgi:NAD(P)-dependent dehydrogenase (short-subunit alcohol dehydrogenase family)